MSAFGLHTAALIWYVGMVVISIVGCIAYRKVVGDDSKAATFISDAELRSRREDCSPKVSRGFIFAMRHRVGDDAKRMGLGQ